MHTQIFMSEMRGAKERRTQNGKLSDFVLVRRIAEQSCWLAAHVWCDDAGAAYQRVLNTDTHVAARSEEAETVLTIFVIRSI